MEGSRKGKGSREKGLPTLDPHVDGGNGKKKIIVYNTKKEKKKRREKKKKNRKKDWRKEKEGKRAKRLKKYNSKRKNLVLLVIVLGHVRGYSLHMYAYNSFLLTLETNIFILDSG